MPTDLSQIVEEALHVKVEDFNELVEKAIHLLSKEDGQVGGFTVIGRLIRFDPSGEAIIASDLHGDLGSMTRILEETGFLQRATKNSKLFLILLGDYGDRGMQSAEVYYVVLKLKLLFPEQVILMRGNHEGPDDLPVSPHDLPVQFQTRFGENWNRAYLKIRELFQHLYNAVIIGEYYLIIHGGLPSEAKNLEDLAYAHTRHPKQRLLEDMLWSDPTEYIEEVCRSPRGAGRLFGEKITDRVLRRFNVKILIRGHEPSRDGFKIEHGGRIITLFSRRGPPYFNVHGAYLNIDLSRNLEDARQLIPFIHKL